MAMKRKQKRGGAPEWMVTYGDMMSLLLTFFIMLVAMSTIEKDEFQKVLESLQQAFGYVGGLGAVPTEMSPANSTTVQNLETVRFQTEPRNTGDSEDIGVPGRYFRVSQVREGPQVPISGRVSFDRFSADIKPSVAEQMGKWAIERIRGHTIRIEVLGHTSNEGLPEDNPFADKLDLAYARAKAVAEILIKHGVNPRRIRITSCGANEPLRSPAYSEYERAFNRRVEVVVGEALINELEAD